MRATEGNNRKSLSPLKVPITDVPYQDEAMAIQNDAEPNKTPLLADLDW